MGFSSEQEARADDSPLQTQPCIWPTGHSLPHSHSQPFANINSLRLSLLASWGQERSQWLSKCSKQLSSPPDPVISWWFWAVDPAVEREGTKRLQRPQLHRALSSGWYCILRQELTSISVQVIHSSDCWTSQHHCGLEWNGIEWSGPNRLLSWGSRCHVLHLRFSHFSSFKVL